MFLELSGIDSTGPRIFVSGNLHTATTTLYGILLASEDGGKTWTEPFARMRAATIEQIQFRDIETGWISGHHIEPLPKDPFFLLTTDGGKSWTMRPVFEETRFGTIAQFWFESRTTGEMVFDRSQRGSVRQELYESQTGGASWNVKQVSSSQIHLAKTRPTEEIQWRVNTDAASHAYRLEQRGPDRWESVASFLVHAGDCK